MGVPWAILLAMIFLAARVACQSVAESFQDIAQCMAGQRCDVIGQEQGFHGEAFILRSVRITKTYGIPTQVGKSDSGLDSVVGVHASSAPIPPAVAQINEALLSAGLAAEAHCQWYSLGHVLAPVGIVGLVAGVLLFMQMWEALRPPPRMAAEEAVADATQSCPAATTATASAEVAAEVARTIGCYFTLVDNIIFSMIIPDSYDVIQVLGGGAILSGAMIGAYKFGIALGALAYYAVLHHFPDIWRTASCGTLLVAALFNLTGALIYAVVVAIADQDVIPSSQSGHRAFLVAIMTSRSLSGIGPGIRLMVARIHTARLARGAARPMHQARFLFANTLGVGIGPVLAALVKTLDGCRMQKPTFLPIGVAWITLCLCELVGLLNFRSVASAPDLLDREESQSLSPSEVGRRKGVILLSLAFTVLRGLCLSGVEAASSMLLEVRYGWTPSIIGLTVGFAFLTCVPFRMLYLRFSHATSTINWILLLIGISILGSCLLFRVPGMVLRRLPHHYQGGFSVAALLMGDALLFPCFFLSDGLVQGMVLQHLLPAETSWMSINGVNLMNTLSLDGFARVVGPPLSRFHIDKLGQNSYATQQLLLTVAAGGIATLGLVPRLDKSPK